MIMPEPDSHDRPFPRLTRLDPPRAVQRAAQFFQLLLARSVFGRGTLPVVSAGAAWLRLITMAGERLEAGYRTDALEFIRRWSGPAADDVAFSRARKSGNLESSGSGVGAPASGRPLVRERTLSWPAEEQRPSRLERLAAFVATDLADAPPETTHPFPMTARTGGWQTGRYDLVPAETARASTKEPRPLQQWRSAQGLESARNDNGVEWFRPVHRSARAVHSGPATIGRAAFPALSSAEALVSGSVGMKAFSSGREHPEAGSGFGTQWGVSVSLRHADGIRQGLWSGSPQALPFARATESADTAPCWSSYAAQSLGRPLGVIPRVILERSFPDLNLSQVRVHTDAPADAAAMELGADAFVLGPDLFFRSGTFNPLTERGLALLTHELVHVRQSGSGPVPEAPSRRDLLEREAREIEGALLRPSALSRSAPPHVDSAGRFALRAFSALPLDLARPAAPPPASDRGTGSHPQRAASLSLEGRADSRPLTAEAGRTVSPEPAPSAGPSGAASGGPDAEGLSRHFFRALERKILIEKERRGIDRWVP